VSSNGGMDLEPLTLPAAPEEPGRQPVPVLAAVVPIAAGVVLWLITGSVFSLCFAALGPLMIGASLLDGIRSRRRARRTAAEAQTQGWRRAEQELGRRHQRERRALRSAHPDAASCLQDPPLRDLRVIDDGTQLVVGSGARRSSLRIAGDDSDRARGFREKASHVMDAPVLASLGRGVCFRGPLPVVSAAARALVVQLCLRYSSSQLALCGGGLEALGLHGFPHAGRPRRGALRVAVVIGDEDADEGIAQIRLRPSGGEVPEGITTVIDCADPMHARLRTAGETIDVEVECLSRPQTVAIASSATEREGEVAQLPDTVALAELVEGAGERQGLGAVIGRTENKDVVLDLAEDGPHAIVTGMTGSGKSELLVTWIAAMALAHSPAEVAFVLADFKGGTAFDPLRDLPHVSAVMTDLDEEGARRGVESLTAELRRREAVLAGLGARHIIESSGALGRLVIVVDEFAALLQEHPDLGVVFTDIAARGRALGMHLILGTQRAAGVIRDALAANCPLRVSLRVTDAADSRAVIGSDEAAELPGGATSRGLAFVRRPQDADPTAVRIALTGAGDLRRAGSRWADAERPISPWLPSLPHRLPLELLAARAEPTTEHALLVGLSDEPQKQRQTPFVLRPGTDRGFAVVGGSGSGRSSVVRVLAAQHPDAVLISADPEQAWDTIAALEDAETAVADLVLCDDLDQLVASFPADHGQLLLERLEKLVRSAAVRHRTVVITSGRVSGQIARVIEGLPARMLLRTGSKLDHLAAGGESDGYRRDRPAGRACIDGTETQIAWTDAPQPVAARPEVPRWIPCAELVGVVAPGVRRTAEQLRAAHPERDVIVIGDRTAEPSAHTRVILVGDAESWQRQWMLWQRVKSDGEMLVLAESATELRSLAGFRGVPPYAETHRGRAWSMHDGNSPRRVILTPPDPIVTR
jgi:S-DNA-T family DNA segregation ATPase FtsK/SpoIIIE